MQRPGTKSKCSVLTWSGSGPTSICSFCMFLLLGFHGGNMQTPHRKAREQARTCCTMRDLNPQPSCCEATVLCTVPPCPFAFSQLHFSAFNANALTHRVRIAIMFLCCLWWNGKKRFSKWDIRTSHDYIVMTTVTVATFTVAHWKQLNNNVIVTINISVVLNCILYIHVPVVMVHCYIKQHIQNTSAPMTLPPQWMMRTSDAGLPHRFWQFSLCVPGMVEEWKAARSTDRNLHHVTNLKVPFFLNSHIQHNKLLIAFHISSSPLRTYMFVKMGRRGVYASRMSLYRISLCCDVHVTNKTLWLWYLLQPQCTENCHPYLAYIRSSPRQTPLL